MGPLLWKYAARERGTVRRRGESRAGQGEHGLGDSCLQANPAIPSGAQRLRVQGWWAGPGKTVWDAQFAPSTLLYRGVQEECRARGRGHLYWTLPKR